jgi:hypothetical protein
MPTACPCRLPPQCVKRQQDHEEAIQDLQSLAHLRLAEITPCHGHAEGRSDLFGVAGGDARVVDSVSARSSATFGQMVRHRIGGSADPSSGIGVLAARLSLRLRLPSRLRLRLRPRIRHPLRLQVLHPEPERVPERERERDRCRQDSVPG